MTPMPLRLVAYHRVSTVRQGRSGLGLEAQRAAIKNLAKERGGTVVASFTEVESGKVDSRPELQKALQVARLTGATLAIAKLDRLSRNAAFLLTLRDSGVRFIAADMPEANDLTVGIMALVAQQEREAIARRTKEALAATKARGRKLGNPNGAAALRRAGKGGVAPSANGRRQRRHLRCRTRARRRGRPLRADTPVCAPWPPSSTAAGIVTRRGGRWHVSNVRNLLRRTRVAGSRGSEGTLRT